MIGWDIDKSPYSKGGDFYYPEKRVAAVASEWRWKKFNPFLERITHLLISRIGKENINAILLSGSFAQGEGSVFSPEKDPLFLSDLDLIVILDSLKAHRRNLNLRGILADECKSLWPSADFYGGITIGLYHTSEISRLEPKPGTFDLAQRSILLWGSDEFRHSLPDYARMEIPEVEGVRLLENRMLAFLGAYNRLNDLDTRGKVEAAYEISRVYTDLLTAALIFTGEYRSGYKARLDYLEGDKIKVPADYLEPGFLARVVWASRYKLSPIKMDHWRDVEGIWLMAASDLLGFWKWSEARRMGADVKADCLELLRMRKSAHPLSVRLRLWREYLAGFGFLLGFWRYLSMPGCLSKKSPMELVLEWGIKVMYRIINRSSEPRIKCPGRSFAFRKDDLKNCAESVYALWVEVQGG